MRYILFVVTGFLSILPHLLSGQELECDGSFFVSFSAPDNSTRIMQGNFQEDQSIIWDTVGIINRNLGPMGFSIMDNNLYALDMDNFDLVKIDGSGEETLVGSLRTRLDTNLIYRGGAILPHGARFAVVGFDPVQNKDVVFQTIRLDVENLRTGLNSIISVDPVQVFDFAYSPIFGISYSFDKNSRKLIQLGNGLIANYEFPSQTAIEDIRGMFFDREGDLYGVGKTANGQENQIFSMDITNGDIIPISGSLGSTPLDACSCPYTIKLEKQFDPDTIPPCDPVLLTYRTENKAGFIFRSVEIKDTMPNGIILDSVVRQPYWANIDGIGSSQLNIFVTDLLLGKDSVVFAVSVDPSLKGDLSSQAVLDSFPLGLGFRVLSDNPETPLEGDISPFVVEDLEIAIEGKIKLCFGEPTTLTADVTPGDANVDFFWSNGENGKSISVSEGGWYGLTVVGACTTLTDSVFIDQQQDNFFVDLGPDLWVLEGEQVKVDFFTNLQGDYSIEWSAEPDPFLSCISCEETSLDALENTIVKIKLENPSGCVARDSIRIIVDRDRLIVIPNIFTPNQDSYNDTWSPGGVGQVRVLRLSVMDRWGRAWFNRENLQLNDAGLVWDGTLNGKNAPAGIYYFSGDFEFPDGTRLLRKGSLTLLR